MIDQIKFFNKKPKKKGRYKLSLRTRKKNKINSNSINNSIDGSEVWNLLDPFFKPFSTKFLFNKFLIPKIIPSINFNHQNLFGEHFLKKINFNENMLIPSIPNFDFTNLLISALIPIENYKPKFNNDIHINEININWNLLSINEKIIFELNSIGIKEPYSKLQSENLLIELENSYLELIPIIYEANESREYFLKELKKIV